MYCTGMCVRRLHVVNMSVGCGIEIITLYILSASKLQRTLKNRTREPHCTNVQIIFCIVHFICGYFNISHLKLLITLSRNEKFKKSSSKFFYPLAK